MKKFLFFLALTVGLGISAQAQNCSKSQASCCKKGASAAAAEKVHDSGTTDAAMKLASLDETIEVRTCEKSGSVSYVKKVVNVETGAVSYDDVMYDSELGKFVNVAPGKACCAKGAAMPGCCTGQKSKVSEASADQKTPARTAEQKKS